MNEADRQKLKNQVNDMLITGYSQGEVAHKLGISRRTVIRYLENKRKETIKNMQASVEGHIADYENEKNKRTKKLWEIVLDPKNRPGERTKAIALLQNEEAMAVKRKQLVGMLPQEAPLVAIQNNINDGEVTIADSIRRKHPELIDKFNQNKMKVIKNKEEEN